MRDGAVRAAFGISLDRAASLVGVCRMTLTRYELNPDAVGPEKREAIARLYQGLRETLVRVKRS